jgi:hypothetical protein
VGSGVANATCVLLAATSLKPPVSWTSVSTNYSDAQGNFSCTDLASTNFAARFYKLQAR